MAGVLLVLVLVVLLIGAIWIGSQLWERYEEDERYHREYMQKALDQTERRRLAKQELREAEERALTEIRAQSRKLGGRRSPAA